MMSPSPSVDQLSRALRVVGDLVTGVCPEQWSAPTPCTDWNVHQLVNHLVAVNLTIASLLSGQAPPERGLDHLGDDPAGAYRASGATLQAAFDQPGSLERSFRGSLGTATGEELLQIRLYDLLAHGWDLAQATGQPAVLPEDPTEQALTFARVQLSTQPRTGRFGPAQPTADDAPAIDRLVAFLGRSASAGDTATTHTAAQRRQSVPPRVRGFRRHPHDLAGLTAEPRTSCSTSTAVEVRASVLDL